jgi:hypothetical protein
MTATAVRMRNVAREIARKRIDPLAPDWWN